jgi:hypothetical protein
MKNIFKILLRFISFLLFCELATALRDCYLDGETCGCVLNDVHNIQLYCDQINVNKTSVPSLNQFLAYGSTLKTINLKNKKYSRLPDFSFNGLLIDSLNLDAN